MAEIIGQILKMMEIPEVSDRYNSDIRKMEPAELVRRLQNEKVSTRGHMPELRGRLLRLEVQKSHPHVQVPWFYEDDYNSLDKPIDEEEKINPATDEPEMDSLSFKLLRLQDDNHHEERLLRQKKPSIPPIVPIFRNDEQTTECSKKSFENKFIEVYGRMVEGRPREEAEQSAKHVKDASIFKNQKTNEPAIRYVYPENVSVDIDSETLFDSDVDVEDDIAETSTDSIGSIDSTDSTDSTDSSIVKIGSDKTSSYEKLDSESIISDDRDTWYSITTTTAPSVSYHNSSYRDEVD